MLDGVDSARVLVVDDARTTRRIASDQLERAGFHVDGAASGEEGLALIADEPPDLVLLDITMPGIDGLEVCRRLKANPATADIPVIFLSALDEVDQVVSGLEAGASDYIGKPFRPAELLARVRAHVRLKKLQEERARLYQQLEAELARAGQVQADMLAVTPPELPGFELAATCLPAREVGGDFYSFDAPAHDVLKLTIGDVMGKGMPAALLMATTRAALGAVARHYSPAATVDLAARSLDADLQRSGSFVTLFHAQLDVHARCLTYVDAGHGHVVLRRSDGRLHELHPRGLPIGIMPDETYEEGTVTMAPGDALVVYSDGLVEARPEINLDGPAIARSLDGLASAADMVSSLLGLASTTGPPPDDLTVVVLKCRA
jgi:serine phosphatase RsbU (regulator of sigma subunit)